ncbi:sigma-70 family RNA polymerase sigma factor [Herbaspirillum sp. LeCh32-8]|uniref:sigma-70 family RNA polymerase sigma factor n=1 Tax=Herbaspirillum sp. LeCh32-8 TaxID=2821356 RepID=UPI001AE2463B|nr:sigma-70 family RNA polymerase sigma factor [Herbaspirillum sp. LeCh32-8]MBP0599799.1 sigma-70 family RNA polymerase sigma factor [Herbaspirillum sp. LeCh32-8]
MSSGAQDAQLAQFYDAHHDWLQGWLRQRLGCGHDAADLSQDTFIQVVAARNVAQIEEPRAFLATLAKRVMFNFWRRRDIERAYLEELAQFPAAWAPSEEDRALVLEALQQIDTVLSGLKPRVREVFLLSQLHELTYSQIGERLGMPVITVRRYMTQAMRACWLAAEPQ